MNFMELLKTPEYDFLRTNEHVKDKIMLLTLGGSYAYGTNIEGSDVDFRGVAYNSKKDLLGYSNFEELTNTETDTTIYGFNKFVNLITNCNPNTIELLGARPDTYFICDKAGQLLRDNVDLFLSRRAIHSFGGYANQQLRRLQNAIARDALTEEAKEQFVSNTLTYALESFNQKYATFPRGSIKFYVNKAVTEGLESEVFADINLKKYPVRALNGLLNEITNILRTYEKSDELTGRNKKKDAPHLNKHAMHLIRLYLTALDILEKGQINTYRGDDISLLMTIRNGYFMLPDGTYKPEFFELVDVYEKRLQYAAKNTMLPEKPNMKKIEDLVMTVNETAIRMF